MKVLVIGATGKFAHLVVPELKKRGVEVFALIREKAQAARARDVGADHTCIGDLEDAASLRAAADCVEGVFHIGPAFAPNESQLGINLVHAAQRARVRRFVFSGVLHPSLPMTNHQAKLPVEQALCQSGMNFTVLQPAMFMQNLQAAWPDIVRSRRFALPYNTMAKGCYVDYRDVAEAAALAFTTDRLDYGTLELCAPGMLSRIQVADLMSNAVGATIDAVQVPFESWACQAKLTPGPLREGLQRMYAEYDCYGFPGGNALALRSILRREPRSMEQFLRELAGRTGVKAA
jgi:uncharacterized protein YbjT (DUF2867 family)